MRSRLCLLLAWMLWVAPGAMAFCWVPQPRLVCNEYFESQLVVEATLLKTVALADIRDNPTENYPVPEFPDAFMYTLRVNRVLRGKAAGNIRILEGNDSGRAGFVWVPGRSYLLFLDPHQDRKDTWALDGCGNSGPLENARNASSAINTIQSAHDGGAIYGEVAPFSGTQSGLRVEARGARTFSAMTNENGQFHMDVPAGKYVVNVVEPGRLFDSTEFSYSDANGIEVEPGGCGQIEFHELSPPPGL
jgi:hypothetical protein